MWTMLIPNSAAYLGSVCLGAAIICVLFDMQGGVNWSKVGAWCALVGGFGVLGGAGGWIGTQILKGRTNALTFGERWGAQAIGAGALTVVILAGLAFAYSRVGKGGKGTDVKGSGKGAKVKSLVICGVFAVIGAVIAGVIPEAYNGVDHVVASIGNGIRR